MDGAGGTADHADRVGAMHAGIGHHVVVEGSAVADEARIIAVALGTGLDAGVATHAAVEVDDHGGGPLDDAVLDQDFQRVGIDFRCLLAQSRQRRMAPLGRDRGIAPAPFDRFRQEGFGKLGQNIFFDDGRRHTQDVGVTDGPKSVLQGNGMFSAFTPILGDFLESGKSPGADITDRLLTMIDLAGDPGGTRHDHQQAIGVIAFLDDDRLHRQAFLGRAFKVAVVGNVPVEIAIGLE